MEVKTDLLSKREVARAEALHRNLETDNMLKALFRNRLFIGASAFFVLCVGGSLLYQQHVRHQDAEKLAETQDRVEQRNERQNPTTQQGKTTSETLQDPSAESSRSLTPQEETEIQRQWRQWREWHDKWNELSDTHLRTTQEWVDALPQTPEELERFKTDENYKQEVQRQLQAAMDKDGKAYVRLQEHEKTRPAIPPIQ